VTKYFNVFVIRHQILQIYSDSAPEGALKYPILLDAFWLIFKWSKRGNWRFLL